METFGGGPRFTARSRQEDQREFPLQRPVVVPVTTVTTNNTTLHTVADGYHMLVRDFGVCNIAGANVAITVYLVPSGGSASAANKVYDGYTVLANDSGTLTALIGSTLEPGDFIVCDTDNATGCNFWLDGIEFSGGVPGV